MFGPGWRVAEVGGVEIRIDPSWGVIAFLIGYSFFSILTGEFPGSESGALIVPAIVMTVLFFLSVLIHELAHSWMARSRGIEVHGITLFVFGGATRARLDTEEPEDELVISVVGPLMSIAIAGVLWGLAVLAGEGTMLGFVAGRLGWINLILAVFNLFPGFPLDGGRILRSLVWRQTEDRTKATRIAAKAGQGLGWGLIALGILQVLAGALVGGLWFAAIGWFLAQSARASFTELMVRELLADYQARDVMSSDPMSIPGDLSLREAVDDYFMRHDHNAFPVARGEETIGLLTMSAVRGVDRSVWPDTTVAEAMEPVGEFQTVSSSDPMPAVVDKMTAGETNRVMVMDGDRVIGLITPRDLTRFLERSQRLGLTEARL